MRIPWLKATASLKQASRLDHLRLLLAGIPWLKATASLKLHSCFPGAPDPISRIPWLKATASLKRRHLTGGCAGHPHEFRG